MSPLRAQARRFAYRQVGGTAIVLVYHRVADLESDPQLLAVRPANFTSHMELLTRTQRVLSLDRLIAGVRGKSLPQRSVAVTFDDGYADNLESAAPVLSANRVPATVFVSSGYVGSEREFWWDELERVVLLAGSLPERVDIELASARFSAGGDDSATCDADRSLALRWNVLDADTLPRHALYRNLSRFVRPLSPTEREDALAQLRAQVGADGRPRNTHRQLTAEQVAELDAMDSIDVGAHTESHVVLSARPVEEQREEISRSRDALARLCGHSIPTFSYPFGSLEDYSAETVALVREAGFAGACSNHLGAVKPWTDPYRIPRVVVRDWDAERFGRELEVWFDEPR